MSECKGEKNENKQTNKQAKKTIKILSNVRG